MVDQTRTIMTNIANVLESGGSLSKMYAKPLKPMLAIAPQRLYTTIWLSIIVIIASLALHPLA